MHTFPTRETHLLFEYKKKFNASKNLHLTFISEYDILFNHLVKSVFINIIFNVKRSVCQNKRTYSPSYKVNRRVQRMTSVVPSSWF